MTPHCSICHAVVEEPRKLAPYWVGDVPRCACKRPGCREAARIEMRTGVTVEDERRVA